MILDKGKNLDIGKIGTQGGEELELGSIGIGVGGDDDNATLDGGGTIW